MTKRKGMGKGKGKGYKNIIGKDPTVHSQSAQGRKQPQKISPIIDSKLFKQKKIEKGDMFATVIREGNLLYSGIDENYNPYRIFEFRGKKFKMSVVEVK